MINKYPDGSSYAEIDSYQSPIFTYKPVFTYRLNSYEDVIHLLQIIEAFNYNKRKPTVRIPCLIDAQADKRFNRFQSSGLKIICNLLNTVEADYVVYHPHNPEVLEALLNNVTIISNYKFIKDGVLPLLNTKHKTKIPQHENTILMSADAGGFKPLVALTKRLDWKGEVESASKSRSYVDGNTVLTQVIPRDDFNSKDVIIIDDICIYGGTFKGLATELRKRNCGKIYLAVSHMTVQHLGENPVTDYFDKVFATNSKYDEYFRLYHSEGGPPISLNPKNLTIIKMF